MLRLGTQTYLGEDFLTKSFVTLITTGLYYFIAVGMELIQIIIIKYINTWCIDTTAPSTQSWIPLALVDVHAHLHQRGRLETCKTLITKAKEPDLDSSAQHRK